MREHRRYLHGEVANTDVLKPLEESVEIGIAWNRRYTTGNRHHIVVEDDEFGWVLLCTGKQGQRHYKGWLVRVECPKCVKKFKEKKQCLIES